MANLRIAYADPPYVGKAARFYNCAEIDHAALIARLIGEFPDGWALSCSGPSLGALLALCPADVRIGAWVKPFATFKRGVNPVYAWEPVIYRGGRRRGLEISAVLDWIATKPTLERGLTGAKPGAFCFWLFALLGLRAGDTLEDLYPGSGAVGRAWEAYRRQRPLRPAPRRRRAVSLLEGLEADGE